MGSIRKYASSTATPAAYTVRGASDQKPEPCTTQIHVYKQALDPPTRVHAFARASCGLAKTDALDAKMLAKFAVFTAEEPATPLPSARDRELAALVARLVQLTDLRQSEICRSKMEPAGAVKASLMAVLQILDPAVLSLT